jgi:hypothetical protein
MMNSRKHVVLITSLGVALALAASQAFGGSVTKRYVRDQFVADSYVVDTGPDVGALHLHAGYSLGLGASVPAAWSFAAAVGPGCYPLHAALPRADGYVLGRNGRERNVSIVRC